MGIITDPRVQISGPSQFNACINFPSPSFVKKVGNNWLAEGKLTVEAIQSKATLSMGFYK